MIRLSGPDAWSIASLPLVFDSSSDKGFPRPRSLCRAKFRLASIGAAVPVLVYFWPEGRSYTGQQTVELHTIGSQPLLEAMVEELVGAGCRLARPGEFTLRAFLAGRIDLPQAEAVLAVVNATDDRSLDVALRQLAGGLRGLMQARRSELLELLSLLEANLDFPEEEDVQPLTRGELISRLREVRCKLELTLSQLEARRTLETCWRVVLTGPPNAGKSSLFNALLGREEALVFDQPGTTRDFLTARWDVDGIEVTLVDCAGLRDTTELTESWTSRPEELRESFPGLHQVSTEILSNRKEEANLSTKAQPDLSCAPDRLAEDLARGQITQAEMEILCVDCSRPLATSVLGRLATPRAYRIVAITKADLPWHPELKPSLELHAQMTPVVITSSLTGEGITELKQVVAQLLRHHAATGEIVPTTAIRCATSLRQASSALGRAIELALHEAGEELVAAEIRLALDAIGSVTGAVYTEDILDQIFSQFCIGK